MFILQDIFKCLEPYIGTQIGSQGTPYECSIKDISVIGVVLGLTRVKQCKYTASPLYGLFCSQHQYSLKCLEPYIGTHVGSQGITYECSIKDQSVTGVVLGLNRVKQCKYTASPLYGLFFLTSPTYIQMPPALYQHTNGAHGITYECSIKDKNVIGIVLVLYRVKQ